MKKSYKKANSPEQIVARQINEVGIKTDLKYATEGGGMKSKLANFLLVLILLIGAAISTGYIGETTK